MNLKKNTKRKVFSFALVAIVITLLYGAITASGQVAPKDNVSVADSAADMPFKLLQIQADVQGSLNDMDSDVANASRNLSATGPEGAADRGVLRKLLETNSNLAEAVKVSKDGKIIVAECKGCGGGEGADIIVREIAKQC